MPTIRSPTVCISKWTSLNVLGGGAPGALCSKVHVEQVWTCPVAGRAKALYSGGVWIWGPVQGTLCGKNDWQTDMTENITFPQLRGRAVENFSKIQVKEQHSCKKKLRLCANKNSMDVKWISFECFIITENYETINFMITHFIGNLLFTRVNCWDFGKLAIKHNNTQVSEIEIQRTYVIINYCPHPLPPRAGGRVLQGAEPSCLIDVHPALKHR